ncbi:hypothetical protein BDR26DRAFT_862651 [Obelidium mucronatum]|nr:hypothetical protein BDR26DRAFT_862651 [Obelidium mucronatum]
MMEVLMNRCWNTDSEVPHRIQRELTILGKKHCDRIVSNTESTVTHFSTFGVDVNRFWGREYFSNDERKFIISVIKEWNQLVENGMDSSDVKQLCADIFERAPSTMAKSLSILIFRSEKQFAPISLILEHCVLMSQISRKICSMAKNNAGKTARLADPSLAVGRSNLRHLSDAINIHFAVYYFAITCDSSFSREVSHLPVFTRIPLCLLYCFNLKIFDCVNQVLLFNRSNTIKDLQRRSDLGITRRHHMNEGTLRAIEVLEGADVLYTTIINARQSIEEDLDSNTEYLELHRFSGPKPKDWIPKDTDKPIAKVMVEKSCEAYRIVNEKFLNSKGEVGKTHLYHYNTTSDMLPASRSVFDRDAKNNAIKLCESPVETHDFYTSGPLLGRVKFAQLKRIHKETKQAMTLSAEFMYNIQTIPIISKTPSAILFQRKDLPGWKVVVECVPFSDSESPLQPLMVKYNAGAGSERILIKYDYSHPKHTVTKAVIESSGLAIATPVEISNDVFGILHLLPFKGVMDSCELLTRDLTPLRRKKFSWSYPFIQVDAVDYFSFPYTTRHQRDILWATWRDGKIPGVFARILDQNILRREQKLYQYWMYRFKGKLMEASDNGNLPEDTLEAVCLDSGTWPTGGGGVGSCRRDVVDSLSSVRWTAIAEIAEMELEKKDYQIEKNIKAITYLPIFDNDLGSFAANKTTTDVIVSEFVPLIGRLVDAIMTEKLDTNRILQDENTIICLYRYFRTHDWKLSWNHPATQRAWVSLYLERAKAFEKSGRLLRHESPTLAQVSMLFTLVSRLLLILSKEIPNIPVVHVSHHGIQGLIAVISKAIHGSSVIVWDHGMLLRERMYALCRDGMPVFTQIGFIGLTRLCSRLIYHRADYVTPCTNIQNVMWAAHLAGGKYLNDFEKLSLHAKCSAVLNGMNLKKFSIKRELARKTPTAVMLSHISPLKDVMNAIKAAYHIVHEFKLKSYELHVYGSPEVDMSYTLTCRMAIKELNLESNVYLKGLGNPALVLPTGWIFVNSSITEGLPLALGEAGLCGLPVVCTNVGGSLEVISDIATSSLYGAIVPPSRPRQLALGQLQVLAMCNGLDTFVDPSICHSPTVQELVASGTANLEHRIMDPQIGQLREKLGEQFGRKTQSVFSITRYCREHEQVLWLGELYSRKSKT